MIFLLIAVLLILFVAFCYYQNNKLDVTVHNIKSERVDKSLKIAHLSDLHSKPAENVIKEISKQKPDVICITGDFINDKCKNKEKMLDYAKRLCKLSPVYYITGNHERRLENFDEIMKELENAGFTVLNNKIAECDNLTILGLDENQADFDDYRARKEGRFVYKDMSEYFETLAKSEKFRLLLCHFPENFMGIKEVNYSQYDYELQLSGHAHGGQWIMPFVGPLFSPGQGVFPKYARGSFGKKPRLIISRGIGNSEFPLRLFNHPELVIIEIEKL